MSFVGNHFTHRYNPNRQTGQGVTNDWIVERHDFDPFLSREPDMSASSLIPMRRYIDESEGALFHAPTQLDNSTLPSFQSLGIAPYAYSSSSGWLSSLGQDLPSPSLSGPTSSYFSSCASDRQSTPLSPPDSGFATWSPEIVHAEHLGLTFGGGHDLPSEQKHSVGYPCVALHDVQSYEDMQPDNLAYEDDTAYYGSYASATHEGYQPVEPTGEIADPRVEIDHDSKDDDYTPRSPDLRRRRPTATRSVTSPRAPSKVTKRSGHTRRSLAPQARTRLNGYNSLNTAASNRAFACALAPYGCASTFGSKNEWKRHVNTQHMRLYYWRCDQCDSYKKPNDFNRKDLFIQHVRRMHPVEIIPTPKKTTKQSGKPAKSSSEDQALHVLAERCFKQDRSPPAESGCHFCDATFEDIGDSSQVQWDKRLEHMAQHMENGKKVEAGPANPSSWQVDARLERWLVKNGIIEDAVGGGYVLA